MYQDTFKYDGYTIKLIPGIMSFYRLRYSNHNYDFDSLMGAQSFIDINTRGRHA